MFSPDSTKSSQNTAREEISSYARVATEIQSPQLCFCKEHTHAQSKYLCYARGSASVLILQVLLSKIRFFAVRDRFPHSCRMSVQANLRAKNSCQNEALKASRQSRKWKNIFCFNTFSRFSFWLGLPVLVCEGQEWTPQKFEFAKETLAKKNQYISPSHQEF